MEWCNKPKPSETDKKIRRFSKIEDDKDVPFFKYYNPRPDPVMKQEKRKLKSTEHPVKKPKLKMKCITCKDKKKKTEDKAICQEKKKIEKYVAPISKKQRKIIEERHRQEEAKYFVCKKEIVRLPSPMNVATTLGKETQYDSAYKHGSGKVVPQKISMTESTLKWPPEPTIEELMLKAPKSKIIINKEKKAKGAGKFPPVDSIDYIYDPKYRQMHPWYTMYRGDDTLSVEPEAPAPSTIIDEEEEIEDVTDDEIEEEPCIVKEFLEEQQGEDSFDYNENIYRQSEEYRRKSSILKNYENVKERTRSSKLERNYSDSDLALKDLEETMEYEDEEQLEIDISKISAQTSVDSMYRIKYPTDDDYDTGSLVPSVINRILQKYQRESETELAAQIKQPFKRGTIKSHSTSKVPNIPVSFYFGVKAGSMHYGDMTFSDRSRFRQGLPITVAAYVFSFVKNPSRWTPRDIDRILDFGDKLFLESLDLLHMHDSPRILQPEELSEVVTLGDKRIKYRIDEPDIAGFTRSEDPKIFDLPKGLTLFFKRHRSGILQSYNTNILIWKRKHFFVFDPEPRTLELFSSEDGTSVLATFYDIPSVVVMLLDRGKLENWPYIISKISIKKIVSKDIHADGDSLTSEFREDSLYKIINPNKAVVNGGLSILDNCFGETKNRQAFAVATIALVYSHVTPSCAWHRKTIDKILLVSNQFLIECLKEGEIDDLKLENIPAFFTIGPLMIEILIYANQYAGLMYRKHECLFQELLTKFFATNTSALVEIDKYVIAIWKFRGVYYMFDPYQRNMEGLKEKDGTACVSMNTDIDTLVQTVVHNYSVRDYIFKIHILKVVRINRDPEYGKLPRSFIDSEESIIEGLKSTDTRSYKPRNITIDKTETAMKTTELEEPLDPSIIEVGSYVGSLDNKYVPVIPKCPSKTVIQFSSPPADKIFDLDSPSLSDTQIERDKPSPLREDSFEFKLLEEITREEMELSKLMDLGEGGDMDYLKLIEGVSMEDYQIEMKDEIIQKGRDNELGKLSAQMNTDLLGLYQYPRVVLEPNKVPRKSRRRSPKSQKREVIEEPVITQSVELAKLSNFILLPDDSEILYGTKNIADMGQDFDDLSPFVSIIAVAMAKKYTLNTWTQEVVDSILEYGYAVQRTIEIKFSDAPKIEIPRLVIGSNTYNLVIDYLFDSLIEPTILESCLEKLVFKNRENCIIVTQNYSAAVFFKRTLYYMYDGFGCNLVGLGEGIDNTGVACMFRFKSLRPLVSRFMYNKKQRELIEPTEASRFIISSVDVKTIQPDSIEKIPRREKQLARKQNKEPPQFESNPQEIDDEYYENQEVELKSKNKVGYQAKGKFKVIEGSEGLQGRNEGGGNVKVCHFTCICAMIGLFSRPINTWDTKRIDLVLQMGRSLFSYIDNLCYANSRNINNLLFDKYFFDLIVKRINIANPKNTRNLSIALNYLLHKNKFLLIQLPSCCYVLYKTNKFCHLFDPYGVDPEDPKSCWIKLQDPKSVLFYLKKNNPEANSLFFFYTIHICKFKRASKKKRIQYELRVTQVKQKKKHKKLKIFNEDEEWLTVYPIPWSYVKQNLACGVKRGVKSHRWFNWDVEYPNDLYSLIGGIHQTSNEFPPKRRGKQTIANCIAAIVMTEIYDFTEWNQSILDSILRAGDVYFNECFESNKEKNYEIRIEDFKKELTVFPYNVSVDIFPLIEGTMFLVRPQQFNISKALRYFFESYENRCGIICSNNGRSKTKYIAFGRIRDGEYFMYDCQTIGPPMFVDRYRSKSYILRCLSLNRLLHCITVTLRSGDFFIYYVGISENQPEEEITNVTDYEERVKNEDDSFETAPDGTEETVKQEMEEMNKNEETEENIQVKQKPIEEEPFEDVKIKEEPEN